MKTNLILITLAVFNCVTLSLSAQGFTNKKEANNQVVNGLKEGKWIEYLDITGNVIPDTKSPGDYRLTIYKGDKPQEIMRWYYMSGNIYCETPYTDGKINGMQKGYFEYYTSGKIGFETPYLDGKINGLQKVYGYNGEVESETPYTNGNINGEQKLYDEKGKLKFETTYVNGNPILQKKFDESGNEIKLAPKGSE